MSQDPVFSPLYKIDRFLSYELAETFKSSPTIYDSAKEWASISEATHQILVEQRTSLRQEEVRHLEKTFAELNKNLNAILDVFREIAIVRDTPDFSEQRYLSKANAAIDQTRLGFRSRLLEFEKLRKKAPDAGAKPLSDRMIEALKNNRLVAILVVVGVILVALGSLFDAAKKVRDLISPTSISAPPSSPGPKRMLLNRPLHRISNLVQRDRASSLNARRPRRVLIRPYRSRLPHR